MHATFCKYEIIWKENGLREHCSAELLCRQHRWTRQYPDAWFLGMTMRRAPEKYPGW